MKEQVKVLIIGMSPTKGGIEMMLMQLFRRTDRDRVAFDFLTFCPKCVFEDEIKQAGGQVFHITRRGVNPVKNRRELIAFYESHRDVYDYIWYHLSSASNCAPIVLAHKYTTAKTICHSHGTSFDSSPLFRPIHLFLDRLNHPALMRSTDYCFACSKAAGEWLFKGDASDVKIIRNGIETERFRFNEDVRREIRQELKADNMTVLGHAGRFCEAKNQLFLLDVFAAYHKLHQNSRLALAGEGEMLQDAKAKAQTLGIQDHVRFLGFRDDFPKLLQAFDVFVMPSLYEGLPISAVEAQAAGCPCVLADTITSETAVTDIVRFLSLRAPAKEWADQIQSSITENKDRASYADAVRAAGYDASDTTAEILRFFCGGDM